MNDVLAWLFDGLGTLLVGLLLGGAAGTLVGVRIGKIRSTRIRQTQKAGNNAQQVQVGRDVRSKEG